MMGMIKKRYIFLAISFAILAAVIWHANPALLAETLIKADIRYVLLALVISMLTLSLRVLKWKVLLNGVGFKELFPIQILGMTISNFTPGKVAEPLKAILLKLRKGKSVSETLPSIIWERIFDVSVILILSLFAVHLITGRFMLLGLLSVSVFIVIIAVFIAVLKNKFFGKRVFSFARKFPLLNKITDDFVEAFYDSSIRKRNLLLCFFITLMAWFLDSVIMYLSFSAIGISINILTLAGILALSTIIGVVSSLPGGIGSSETAMVLMLGIIGISGTSSIAGILIFRVIAFWCGAFVGMISFIYLSRKIDMKNLKF